MKFNQKLIKLRKDRGMTQEDLAFKIGVTRQSISKWEIGDCEPDISKLVELAKIFKVSTDFLLIDDIFDESNELNNNIPTIVNNKLLPFVLVLIGGIGFIVSFVLVFLFPHITESCGGKGNNIIKYLILDWCQTAVLWRFCLFLPSLICVIISIFLYMKERKYENRI